MVEAAAWSPCGRFIAVARSNPAGIEVLDAATLERLYTFKSHRFRTSWLSFSPDSRLLTRFDKQLDLTSWDLQTGGSVSTISSGPDMHFPQCLSSTYSMDGKMLAVAYGDFAKSTSVISTYDLLSRTHTCCYRSPHGFMVVSIWTHGECIRFATLGPGSIAIWEVGFTSTDMPTEVERLPVPGDVGHLRGALFLPIISRLATASPAGLMVWDARDSKFLLNFVGNIQPVKISFSSDGRFLACGTAGPETYIWEESHTGYILRQKLTSVYGDTVPSLSPDGESIITVSFWNIQLWRTAYPTPSLSIVPTQSAGCFILEFSPDEKVAAVGRVHGNTATVLDPGLVIHG